MKKRNYITILFIALIFSLQAQTTFRASAPNAVVVGQPFNIEYTLNDDGKDFRAPDFKNFRILMGPRTSSGTSMTIVNGQMSRSITSSYTYTLLAEEEGTFTVPSATITSSGKTYNSNSLTIKVIPQEKQSAQSQNAEQTSAQSGAVGLSNKDIFVRFQLSKTKVYEQEAVLGVLKLYSKTSQIGLEGIKLPEIEGAVIQEIDPDKDLQFSMDQYNGVNYYTVPLKQYLIFPQKSGKIVIPSARLNMKVQIPRPSSGRSIFDSFFEQMQVVQKELLSPEVSIQVSPLPSGKPNDFSGGVGNFTMTSSITAQSLKANQALTLKVVIKGNGNLKYTKNPAIEFPVDFETYDPVVNTNLKVTSSGVSGTKTIEYTAIPRQAGSFVIPSATFSYFDLGTKTYKTMQTPEYKIQVEKGDESSATTVVGGSVANKEQLKFLGQDIRYIDLQKPKKTESDHLLFGSFWYYLYYVLFFLIMGAVLIYYRRQLKAATDTVRMKNKKANKVAGKRLKQAAKYLQTHEKEAFYDEVMRAVWGYLSDKLTLPLSVLTKDNVRMELEKYGASEELIRELTDILQECEFARYAPSQGDQAMEQLYERTTQAISKMENTTKK